MHALYPGTFDPPTLGHLDIIRRASAFCERLTIGIGQNHSKQTPVLTIEERKSILETMTGDLPNVEVVVVPGLVTEFAEDADIDLLIRGLRSQSDWGSEQEMAMANRKLTGIETLFLFADQSAQISSTLIRELASHGAPLQDFVTKEVENLLNSKEK